VILSDGTIRTLLANGRIRIAPLGDDQIQPASVDLRLGRQFRVIVNHSAESIDPYSSPAELTTLIEVPADGPFILHPGEFVLGTTVECLGLPDDIVARVDGKSSLGRWGVLIHATAGFIDAGFTGEVTLELSNVATLPVKLWPGMKIGQVSFMPLDAPAQRPYGSPGLNSKYQGQRGPQASQYGQNIRPSD
jgi:dCTP deaminase